MFDDLIREHSPKGWKIVWKEPENKAGQFLDKEYGWCKGLADFDTKTITCVPVRDRYTLAVFLHECGHVNLKHGLDHYERELAQCEFEAEDYAIKAMRAGGLSVPRIYLLTAKAYVDACVRNTPNEPQTDECLKFAYGAKWRLHI